MFEIGKGTESRLIPDNKRIFELLAILERLLTFSFQTAERIKIKGLPEKANPLFFINITYRQ